MNLSVGGVGSVPGFNHWDGTVNGHGAEIDIRACYLRATEFFDSGRDFGSMSRFEMAIKRLKGQLSPDLGCALPWGLTQGQYSYGEALIEAVSSLEIACRDGNWVFEDSLGEKVAEVVPNRSHIMLLRRRFDGPVGGLTYVCDSDEQLGSVLVQTESLSKSRASCGLLETVATLIMNPSLLYRAVGRGFECKDLRFGRQVQIEVDRDRIRITCDREGERRTNLLKVVSFVA